MNQVANIAATCRAAPKMRMMYRASSPTPRVLFHAVGMGGMGGRCVLAYYGEFPEASVAVLETSGVEGEEELTLVREVYAACERVIVVFDLTAESVHQALRCSACLSAHGERAKLFWNAQTLERVVRDETLWNLGTMQEPEALEGLVASLRELYPGEACREAVGAIWRSQRTLQMHAMLHPDLKMEYVARVGEVLGD